jgi:signal transduction histidine kinase
MTAENSPVHKSPIWTRLSLRLGFLMGVVLVILLAFQPVLEEWIGRSVGIHNPEWLAGLEEAVDTAIWVVDGIEKVEGSEVGDWYLPAEDVAELAPIMDEFERGYLWVLPNGSVQAASPSFQSLVGKPWPHPLEVDNPFAIQDDHSRPAVAMPVEMADDEENLAGHVIAVKFGENAAFDGEGRFFLEEYEVDLYMLPLHDHLVSHSLGEAGLRLRRWVALGFSAAIALLLSLVITRLVTRRLFHLIHEADQPVTSDADLPGPFPVEGSDEVTRLARALNRMRDRVAELLHELKTQDQERKRWIAQVSHDIRTPLAALTACLDRAHRLSARGELQEQGDELLEAASHDAARVRTLAEDLLEVARLEAREPLRRESVMPEELIGGVARGFNPLVKAKGLNLILEVHGPLPDLHADGRLLVRAVENLLRNALRHARSQVRIFATVQSEQLVIEVSDDGDGFKIDIGPLEDRRLEQLRKAADSTGLGLQLARQVVEAHDGSIELDQGPLGGAAVRVTVPLAGNQLSA